MTRLTITLLTLLLLDPTPAQAQVNEQDALAHDNAIDGPDRVSLNAKIAFVSLFGDDGKPGIYVINPDGSNATRLASGGGPIWSPDGTKIAFVSPGDGSNAEIYVINADGSSLTNLTNHPATEGAPSWSPDGTKIAFLSNRDGQFGLYSMNPDGSDQTRLTKEARDSSYPIWSPDGTKIAYTLGNAIYVTGADGSNATRLATGEGLTWSPDGTKIAFLSGSGIIVMNADGSNQTRLGGQRALLLHPAWSPDGTKIAFVEFLQSDLTISVMNADGSNQTRLGGQFVFTMDEQFRNQLRLTWSPDGSTLAFTGCEDIMDPRSNWDIYSVDLDGKLAQLTSNAGYHMYVNPVWSPLLK